MYCIKTPFEFSVLLVIDFIRTQDALMLLNECECIRRWTKVIKGIEKTFRKPADARKLKYTNDKRDRKLVEIWIVFAC